jgi:hypothetical protein
LETSQAERLKTRLPVVATVVVLRLTPKESVGKIAGMEGSMPALSSAKSWKAINDAKRCRAQMWKAFRRDYLFSQRDLAAALKCSLRTVQAIEGEEVVPQARIQRRFRDLKSKQEKLASA